MTEPERAQRKRLNLRLLEIFAAVVHENGMTGAAATLNLTQSAVSQAIANLETSVNARLIDRGTRPVQLTLIGDIIYRRTVEILDRVTDLDSAIELYLHNMLPMLRVGMINTIASTAGPHLVRKLDKLAAQWTIWSGNAEASVRSLVERKVDFIITSQEVSADGEFVSFPVFEEPFFLVMPTALKEKTSLENLAAAAPLIRYGTQTFMGPTIEAYFQRAGVVPPNHYHLDTTDAVLAMVEEGLGWTISTPLCILKARINSPRIHCAPLHQWGPTRRICVVTRASENTTIAKQITTSTKEALEEHCLPRLRAIAPEATFHIFP